MFGVYEEYKNDEKRFLAFEDSDRLTCEIWAEVHKYDTRPLLNRKSQFVIVEED